MCEGKGLGVALDPTNPQMSSVPRVLCFEYSVHEDIKRALLWSSEGVEESDGALTCEEVFSRALTCALRRDGEEEDDPVVKAGKRTEICEVFWSLCPREPTNIHVHCAYTVTSMYTP